MSGLYHYPMVENITVVAPDSVNNLTPYVLTEQQDWFEDEIKFVRTFLQPGMICLDIGANYGLYTLSMANRQARVWAFEPTPAVMNCLRQSVAANGFGTVQLLQAGLSNRCGTARFALNANPEMNSILADGQTCNVCEEITLTTLDTCAAQYNWKQIDFIKLDAEGEEVKILQGGESILTTASPLVMFEFKLDETINFELIEAFSKLGYSAYRLVPGAGVLIPFDCLGQQPDSYQLNLFACKAQTAQILAARDLLIASYPIKNPVQDSYDKNSALEYLRTFSYAQQFLEQWALVFESDTDIASQLYTRAFCLYARSQNSSETQVRKCAFLLAAAQICTQFPADKLTAARLLTFARICAEAGERASAVRLLGRWINGASQNVPATFTEPFIPPLLRYADMTGGGSAGDWIFSAALEAFELLHAFSSYYTNATSLPSLKKISALGFGSEEMNRRLELINVRFSNTTNSHE